MNKSIAILVVSLIAAAPVAAQQASAAPTGVVATEGKMLVDPTGARLAPVQSVNDDGSVQIIIDGKVVTVPADTLSMKNGELTTSLKKPQVIDLPQD